MVGSSGEIVLGSTNLPPTGTELLYLNFPGGSLAAGTRTSGTTSGGVPSGLTNGTVAWNEAQPRSIFMILSTMAENNGVGKPSSGLTSISGVSGTGGNHCLVGRTGSR